MNLALYNKICNKCSRITTNHYSTSFSVGIYLLAPEFRKPIYSIYGFVRFADEIVDTFHAYNQKELLYKFGQDTIEAIRNRISSNPILHSFQQTVHEFDIDTELIRAFLRSMEMDTIYSKYDQDKIKEYIYGSAEVVGLMCLRVFCNGNDREYNKLLYPAQKLGEAFQKVNFLRDIRTDFKERGRIYFPGIDFYNFTIENKRSIEEKIQYDFDEAARGIANLNKKARFGVYIAYMYYLSLFRKIRKASPQKVLEQRIRVSNPRKLAIFFLSFLKSFFIFKKVPLAVENEKKLNLFVEIDKNSGFCFGVINSIKKAEEVLEKSKKLYCLGDIVHNDYEIQRLVKKGIIIINHNDLPDIRNEKILIRAHGEPPLTYQLIKKNNNEIIEASCPIILKLQEKIRVESERLSDIYIYGRHNHPETKGLAGQTNNEAVVFEDIQEILGSDLPEELSLYSQTTQDITKYKDIQQKLAEKGVRVIAHETICAEVSNRQPLIKEFCARFDKIVFIAGKKSSNGKVLFNTCKSVNKDSVFISHPDELLSDFFNPNEKVGICGATSTPRWLMKEVKEKLESL